jgi:hypothetical protein
MEVCGRTIKKQKRARAALLPFLDNDVLFLRGVPADSNAAASGESSELGM